jgi:hypothetical protein
MAQTTLRGISRRILLRVERIGVLRMGFGGHPRTWTVTWTLPLVSGLFASLLWSARCLYGGFICGISSPRPSCITDSVFASRLCPDRIMHPHPVSDVKPWESMSWLRRRTPRVMDDVASGVLLRGIGAKLDRYVIHILDSKSSRNAFGHELGLPTVSFGAEFVAGSSRLGVSSAVWRKAEILLAGLRSYASRDRNQDQDQGSPVLFEVSPEVGVYSWPRHQIEALGTVSFLGSGSQKYCTIRLHFSRSTPAMSVL